MSQFILILLLSVILLKPKDIELLIKTSTKIIIKINKYINQIKNDLFKI